MNEVLPGSELQHREGGIPREHFARLYKDAMHEYINVKETIKQGNLLEIKYEEFQERPVEILRDIYHQFKIPGINEALPRMESYLNKNRSDARQSYQIESETYHLVNDYAGDVVKRLGYQLINPSGEPLKDVIFKASE